MQYSIIGPPMIANCPFLFYSSDKKLRFFEQEIKKSRQEDFSKWDDYIEWKAYLKTAEDIAFKIQEVKNGHFAIT